MSWTYTLLHFLVAVVATATGLAGAVLKEIVLVVVVEMFVL